MCATSKAAAKESAMTRQIKKIVFFFAVHFTNYNKAKRDADVGRAESNRV